MIDQLNVYDLEQTLVRENWSKFLKEVKGL